jgi:hypothetical protein
MSAQAFLAASLKTDGELLKWFRDRLVWNEPETVVDLLKQGLFVRLYEPQVRAYQGLRMSGRKQTPELSQDT